ncbi:MAG: hypothetical protein AAF292_03215 [Pseudomonadota bacterium]
MKLFSEIRRRQVIQGAIAYGIVGWLLIQLAIALEASLELPPYVDRWVTIGVIGGFPVAILLAWLFDISLSGMRLTSETDQAATETETTIEAKEPPPKHSIAILPFADMSPDGDQEYLGDGVAEEILNALVKVTELRVTGRTSSFAYKGQNLDIREIGESLNVAHVLEGSVRRQGDRVRITAQLIQTDNGFHLWSETYDGDLKDIFDLQDTISKQIVSELEILLDAEGARLATNLTSSPEAYDAFLRGRELFHKLVGDETLPQAIKFFERAVELDPKFADAWAHLALSHLNLPELVDTDDPSRHYSAAEIAIERAQAINTESALVERAIGLILCVKRDFFGAVQAYERSYKLDPDNPFISFGFAYAMASIGLHEKALELFKKTEASDPSAPYVPQWLAMLHFSKSDWQTAIFYYQKADKLGYVPARASAAFAEAERGRIREAYAWMRNYMKDAPTWFRDRLKSPLARHVYYAAALKKTPFYRWLVGRATLARLKKTNNNPTIWDPLVLLEFCGPEHYFEFIRKTPLAYGLTPIVYLFYETRSSRAARAHKDFPQFAEDIGLVKIWQTYGWPEQVQPNPGTDGSNLQFTVS